MYIYIAFHGLLPVSHYHLFHYIPISYINSFAFFPMWHKACSRGYPYERIEDMDAPQTLPPTPRERACGPCFPNGINFAGSGKSFQHYIRKENGI